MHVCIYCPGFLQARKKPRQNQDQDGDGGDRCPIP